MAEQHRELNVEYRIVGADGKARWIESRGLISYNGDGCPTRMVGVHIDTQLRKSCPFPPALRATIERAAGLQAAA